MSTEPHTAKLWFEKLQGSDNYRPWSKNMISTFESENLDEVVFEKVEKPGQPTTKKGLDELEFREMLRGNLKQNESLPDREEIKMQYAHYKNEWKRYEDWIQKDRRAKTLIRQYSEPKLHSNLLDSHNSTQYWNTFKQNYQNPTVAPMFYLFKKVIARQENGAKSMSNHTSEIQHLIQCMEDLATLTTDMWQALIILRSLSSDHSQLVQQIKAMDLRDFTTAKITHLVNGDEKPKSLAAVAGVKRKSDSTDNRPAKRFCSGCRRRGHTDAECYIQHPELRPQNQNPPSNKSSQNQRNKPLQARVTAAEETQESQDPENEED
jgi:gag-polypeptide of LTR copia-type